DRALLLADVVVEDGAQVALARRGEDHNNRFPSIFGASGQLSGCPRRRATADAHEQPLFAGKTARHLDRVIIGHGDDLIDQARLQHIGHKASANALNLGWPRLATRKHRRGGWLDRDHLQSWLARFKRLADAGQRATRPDARYHRVYLALGVAPDLLRRRLAVNLWVGGILELLWHPGARCLLLQLFHLRDGSRHA